MNRRILLLGTSAALGAGIGLRPALAQSATITGAGATFPRPVYERWGQAAREPLGVTLNYQSIGSGGGINQITNRTVDFGATDAPLSEAQLAERRLMQFPTVMGSVVPIVNLPGVADNALRLTAEILVEIYLGTITRWNDAKVAELNPGLRIPPLPVSPVYRADSSGTTFVFTSYLARISQTWRDGPGAGTSVQWPKGQGQRGNEGVSNSVRNTPGAIGYTENAYATVNRLVTTQLRNRAGQFVRPETANFAAAADQADWNVPGFAADLINLDGATTWPIVSPTFVLVPTDVTAERTDTQRNVLRLFDWAFRNGADAARRLEYIPLPAPVQDRVRAAWAQLRAPGGRTLWPVG